MYEQVRRNFNKTNSSESESTTSSSFKPSTFSVPSFAKKANAQPNGYYSIQTTPAPSREVPGHSHQSRSVANRNVSETKLINAVSQIYNLNDIPVTVKYNSCKPAQFQAKAFAQGDKIYIAPGQEKHLPHELCHIAQQLQGRVQPTMQLGGVPLNDDPKLEREADVMGAKAVAIAAQAATHVNHEPVQRFQQIGRAVQAKSSREQPLVQQVQHSAMQRMVDFTRDGDEDFEYSESISEAKLNGMIRITKSKELYKSPDKSSEKLGTIAQYRIVEQIEAPRRKDLKNWAKVKVAIGAENQEGWINTKESLNDNPEIVHEKLGVIMENDPTPDDIIQHMFGDCALLSPLSSLTRKSPDSVRNRLFVTDPQQRLEQHKVRFYAPQRWVNGQPSEFREDTVTVTNTVLKTTKLLVGSRNEHITPGNYGSRGNQPWPAIIEKAFAAWPGKDLDNLEGGQAFRAAMYLTGDKYENFNIQVDNLNLTAEEKEIRLGDNKTRIIQAINKLGIITATTQQSVPEEWRTNNPDQENEELRWGGITFKHAYEVVDANNETIRLRNPHGRYSRINGTVEENYDVSVLSWEEFFTVCSHVSLRKEEN